MLVYFELVGPRRFKFLALAYFCGTYFYKAGNTMIQHKILCTKHIEKFVKIFLLIMLLMNLAYAIVFAVPMYESHRLHNRMTPLATNLPFFEKNSITEFYVNLTIQIILAGYSLLGTFVIELAACAINHAILLVPDLIRFNLFELQKELNEHGISSKIFMRLRNTFIQLQDFNRFDNSRFFKRFFINMIFHFFITDICSM